MTGNQRRGCAPQRLPRHPRLVCLTPRQRSLGKGGLTHCRKRQQVRLVRRFCPRPRPAQQSSGERCVLVPICCCTADEKGLCGGGIEGLLGRWVGGTMGDLPVVTARATANAGGRQPKELRELNGCNTGATP